MSSFFTTPASQKKRKRTATVSKQSSTSRSQKAAKDDDEISSPDEDEGSSDEAFHTAESGNVTSGSESEVEDEDPAAKRIRLAEQYLANTQRAVLEDAAGFDAKLVDEENLRHRMGQRLKEDTAEGKGKIYRFIAEDLDWQGARNGRFRGSGGSVTSIAMDGKGAFAYSATADGYLGKWALPKPGLVVSGQDAHWDKSNGGRPAKRKPRLVAWSRSRIMRKKVKYGQAASHHTGSILCIAASQDGKFVVTGGADNRIFVWNASDLSLLKAFPHHRDSVTSLAFRRGTNQLYSASKDRTVKVWSLNELAYVETLFGHQDEVVDIDALAQERCITAGARDRTARLWKVVEESQLVFRGGGASAKSKGFENNEGSTEQSYHEGSIDRLCMLDDETFITASDAGTLSLWSIHKKKPVFTYPLAHGLDPPLSSELLTAETDLGVPQIDQPKPRWITAMKAIPFSDTFVTGSWDGSVRVWKLSSDRRSIEALGALSRSMSPSSPMNSTEELLAQQGLQPLLDSTIGRSDPNENIPGIVNDLAILDRDDLHKSSGTVTVLAAVGKDHRLGRWKSLPSKAPGWNGCVMYEIQKLVKADTNNSMNEETGDDKGDEKEQPFEGFV